MGGSHVFDTKEITHQSDNSLLFRITRIKEIGRFFYY